MRSIFPLAVVPVLLLFTCARADNGWQIDSPGRSFRVSGKIRKGEDVSGAAMVNRSLAVVASDETRELQFLRIEPENAACQVAGAFPLLETDGTEIDIEGVAVSADKSRCYVTGSHALSRQKQRFETERGSVFSVAITAQGTLDRGSIRVASLRDHLKADPVLGTYLDRSAAENGLDIEGLAVREGKLYFGLRAPNLDGNAFVVSIPADALFAGGKASLERVPIKLGPGRGIRDMAGIDGGWLLITGPSGSDDSGQSGNLYTVVFWTGGSAVPVKVGDLPSPRGKPEGLLVLAETPTSVDILVFHDGGKDGAPLAYRITRTPAS